MTFFSIKAELLMISDISVALGAAESLILTKYELLHSETSASFITYFLYLLVLKFFPSFTDLFILLSTGCTLEISSMSSKLASS